MDRRCGQFGIWKDIRGDRVDPGKELANCNSHCGIQKSGTMSLWQLVLNEFLSQETTVELLTLHKTNFDFFVRDLQAIERRENLHLLTECTLFKSWSKASIRKIGIAFIQICLDYQ